jgi:hypothetical protein
VTVVDTGHVYRLTRVVSLFRDMHPDAFIAALAHPDGGSLAVTYGDLAAALADLGTACDRLGRISTWHSRETGEHGTVGDFCVDCGHKWPCDTRRMADGTYEDEDDL